MGWDAFENAGRLLSAVCGAAGKALHLDPSPGSDGADGADGLLWNPIYVEIQYKNQDFWGDVDTQGSVITCYHHPLSYGASLGGESSGDPKSSAVSACRRRQGGGTSVETGRHCGKGQRIDLQSLQIQKFVAL